MKAYEKKNLDFDEDDPQFTCTGCNDANDVEVVAGYYGSDDHLRVGSEEHGYLFSRIPDYGTYVICTYDDCKRIVGIDNAVTSGLFRTTQEIAFVCGACDSEYDDVQQARDCCR